MTDKASKAEAQYTPDGTKAEHCSICRHYTGQGTCARVQGAVLPNGWCKYWLEKLKVRGF